MSLKPGDLKEIVSKKIHIDEYASKMGKDEDIITLSFKIKYYDPAVDLTNFLEKGYDWVLDADVSSGAFEDGDWIVFVEMMRRPSASKKIMEMLKDLESLCGNRTSEYEFAYRGDRTAYQPATIENIEQVVPMDPRAYRKLQKKTVDQDKELMSLQDHAGIVRLPKTDYADDVKEFANLSRYR